LATSHNHAPPKKILLLLLLLLLPGLLLLLLLPGGLLVARGGLLGARGAGGGSGGAGKPIPKNWALIAHKIYIFTPSRTSRTPKLNNHFSFPQSPRRVKKNIYAG
jgi:hypothetical protein